MGRPGLPLIILLALLTSYVAAGVTLVAWPRGEQSHGSGPKLHAPSTVTERAAAGAAIAHMRVRHHAKRPKAIDARVHGATAAIAVSGGGGVIVVRLRRERGAWRVVEHHPIGYV
jgi:hypothetical protein